ncbi:phenylalanine--tRNA ligase subunit beta [Paralimibaculum aggregatum]|uniref:Phenylalanine--tRNA ligase beta subunit n=1 Tax=Paralimibaculum aggregatum TaxID=3036245 RepID=A0ABQ6LMC6_9RHOB|nr:phenylalanine--tRNA ligase subunit beta [Limibaculum sp. NKW23]GMG83454.1 phenylalanine--tRNA ligase subunit beta [Limibaculum sp. NKW23]
MKFTLAWLKDHLDTEASLDEIAEALTDLGLEVEGIENPVDRLGAFRIARVIEAAQHPNADRLRVCRVAVYAAEGAAPEEVQVVCGAPNARTGLVGVFAPAGTHVPGTGVDLKPGVIRGVESNGMLCSEREMMISEDHDGIIDLPEDAPLGARFIDYAGLNDPVIEIAITPNRPDALGVAGIARDLAARGIGRLKTPPLPEIEGRFPCPISVEIHPDLIGKGCPLFVGRLVKGVKNGPSPAWLQQRLKAIGLRPISALVDITNYITFDRGRPLHVFDADKVAGGRLSVHPAKGGETLLALDGKEYVFEPGMMVIADDNGPESIGGIMGGELSGCTGETVNVFVESAYWDPVTIAATGRRLKINSDARYRFERGVDPAFTPAGADLGTAMVLELCGGEASETVVAGAVPDTSRSYTLRPGRVASLVGMEVPREEQVRILTALGFSATGTGEAIDVWVPSWRPDIHGEADLVEEIARVASLSGLEAKPLPRPASGVARSELTAAQLRAMRARRRLASAGLAECVSYSFVSGTEAALFGGGEAARKLANPISSEMSDMRPSLLPGLLAAAARNQARGFGDLGLFEVGPVFEGAEPGEQANHATALRVGATAPRHWTGERRPVDLADAKADAEAALAAAGVPVDKLQAVREAPGWFHPGRSGALKLGPKVTLAVFGELHPKVLDAMDVKGPAVAATILLDAVPAPKRRSTGRAALSVSDYQAVERDFAFVLDAKVEAETVLRAARSADKKLIAGATVFDLFEGAKAAAQFGEGRKSMAITVRLEPKSGTLTEDEIDRVAAEVVAAVTKATGGQLRG